jgi:Protein of unknown function (DUF1552)
MIITGKHLSRRTLLRGLGVSMALPWLDAMRPAFAAPGRLRARRPVRMMVTYAPNGMVMKDWTPEGTGANYTLSPILKAFEPHREEMLVLTGLMDHNGNALGDGGGDHARAGASFLTGVHPKKTAGADIEGGVSMDQVAAKELGAQLRFASLELGCEDSRTVGNCDSGYSCAYTNSLSWKGPKTPNPPEINPRAVFERLFGSEDVTLPPEVRARRMADRKSILDMVQSDTQRIVSTLGGSDRKKMDEYLTAVREIEQRIQKAEADNVVEVTPGFEAPAGIPFEFAEYLKLMLDLTALAFQADLTRVVTLMLGREGSLRTYNEIGVPDGHHPLSHHGNRPDWLARLSKINQYHTQLFAPFIEKLKTTPEGDGTLLSHSMILYGGALSDSNRHIHENLPILLFGRGDGSLKPGRHVVYQQPTPMTNLYLTMLDRMGVKQETIGDSTGKVEHLSEL